MGMRAILFACVGAAGLLSACSRSNNLWLGRVETTVGTHPVVVTDCYRSRVPPPQKVEDTTGGPATYRFTPCRDAAGILRGEALVVNGQSYGRLRPTDAVTVDHGVVSINGRAAHGMASP